MLRLTGLQLYTTIESPLYIAFDACINCIDSRYSYGPLWGIWSLTVRWICRTYRWRCCSIAADPSLQLGFMVIFWGRNRGRRVAGATKLSFPARPLLLHGDEWLGVLLLNQIGPKMSTEVEYGSDLELSIRPGESSARLMEEEMMKMQGNVCVDDFPTIVTTQEKIWKTGTTNLENSKKFELAA